MYEGEGRSERGGRRCGDTVRIEVRTRGGVRCRGWGYEDGRKEGVRKAHA